MSLLPLLLLSLAQAGPDVVHTLDGRRLEGRVAELDRLVEIRGPEGRPLRVWRHQVLRIDYAPDWPRNPEVVPLPPDALDRAEADFLSWGRVLVAVPKDHAGRVVAVDAAAARRLWDLEVPGRFGRAVLNGPLLYLLSQARTEDGTRKVKVDGVAQPRELHVLTVRVVDVLSGRIQHQFSLENTGKRDAYWSFATNPAPSFHFLADRVVLKTARDGFPIDGAGNVDKTKPLRYASFTWFDPAAKTLGATVESPDAADAGGICHFGEDLAILQVFRSVNAWTLVALGARDGKLRWESEVFAGKLQELGDDVAWISDHEQLFPLSLKTGKRAEKGAIELEGAVIGEVTGGTAFLYRDLKEPRELRAVNLKRGSDVFRLKMPGDSRYAHLKVVGPRLLFTDHLNRIHAVDLVKKKEDWVWEGAGKSFLQSPVLIGGGLAFFKDGRVVLLDPSTGKTVWEVKGGWRAVVPVGDEGFLAQRLAGADLVRRRRTSTPGVYLTPGGTALRYAHGGEDSWSPPAAAGGFAYLISSMGAFAGIDLKDLSAPWAVRVSRTPVNALASPLAAGDALLLNVGGESHAWSISNRGQLYKIRNTPPAIDRQIESAGGIGFACSSGAPFVAIELESGRKVWESSLRSVLRCAAAGDAVHALSNAHYSVVDASSGAVRSSVPLPRGATLVAADATRAILAAGPYGFGTASGAPGEPQWIWRPENRDPKVAARFKGHLVLAPGGVLYSHADGGLVLVDDAGKELWSVEAPGFTSAPMVHEGKVYVAAGGPGLLALDLKDGRTLWSEPVADASLFVPILWEGKPAFWSLEGWILPVPEK